MKLEIIALNSCNKDVHQTSYKSIFFKYLNILENYGDILNKKVIISIVKNKTSGETLLYIN